MVYNLTSVATNTTSIVNLVQGVNVVLMGGWLGVFFLLAVTIIAFMSFQYTTGDSAKSLAACSFIAFVLANPFCVKSAVSRS